MSFSLVWNLLETNLLNTPLLRGNAEIFRTSRYDKN